MKTVLFYSYALGEKKLSGTMDGSVFLVLMAICNLIKDPEGGWLSKSNILAVARACVDLISWAAKNGWFFQMRINDTIFLAYIGYANVAPARLSLVSYPTDAAAVAVVAAVADAAAADTRTD